MGAQVQSEAEVSHHNRASNWNLWEIHLGEDVLWEGRINSTGGKLA
jgi:hypothetical protein